MSDFEDIAHKTVVELFDMLKEKVAEIEQLKANKEKLQKQFNFLLDKNIRNESEHATLKLKFMSINHLVKSLRSEFDLNSDCSQVDRQIELLEEALRGANDINLTR